MTRPVQKVRPHLEHLEDRCLLASAVLSSAGVLTIKGSDYSDTITVRQINGNISIDGTKILKGSTSYNRVSSTSVTQIYIYGYGGNDTIRCDSESWSGQQGIYKNITAYGGAGNDYIRLSYGNDTIYGGDGNDTLYGRYGNDLVSGNAGNDTVDGWYGYDTLYGGVGNDILRGGANNDYLYGGDGKDRLFGGDGADHLYGNAGMDYLNGNAGADQVTGGSGVDTYRRNLQVSGFNLNEDPEDAPADEPQQVAGAFLSDSSPPTHDSFWDIDQEQSATCAFLAALAAVSDWTGDFPQFGAANKDLISYIKYDAASNTYGIPLYVNGAWHKYWVNGDWTQGYDPNGPLWVTLYQKAYLKAMNVVTRYADGTPMAPSAWYSTTAAPWRNSGNALTALTGYAKHWVSNSSMSAQKMHDRLRNGDILTASSYDNASHSAIPGDHAFHVYDVYYDSSAGTWYVKLYNPWGHDTKTFGVAQYGSDDGLIKITWSTFKKYFEGYYWA